VNALTALTHDDLDVSFGRSSRANFIVKSVVAGADRVKIIMLPSGYRLVGDADTAVERQPAQIGQFRPLGCDVVRTSECRL
jgi:hypothetical protein